MLGKDTMGALFRWLWVPCLDGVSMYEYQSCVSGNVTSNMPQPNVSGAAVQKSFGLFSPFLCAANIALA